MKPKPNTYIDKKFCSVSLSGRNQTERGNRTNRTGTGNQVQRTRTGSEQEDLMNAMKGPKLARANRTAVTDALIDLVEFFRDGHSTTSKEIAERYGVSHRTAQRWAQKVTRWVPLKVTAGFDREFHYRVLR